MVTRKDGLMVLTKPKRRTIIGKRIFMLHGFVKKSKKAAQADLSLAIARMGQVKRENS